MVKSRDITQNWEITLEKNTKSLLFYILSFHILWMYV